MDSLVQIKFTTRSALVFFIVSFSINLNSAPSLTANNPCTGFDIACEYVTDLEDPGVLRRAILRIPRSGGTIFLDPGTYRITRKNFLWMANFNRLRIIGLNGKDGSRARVQMDRHDPPAFLIPWLASNGSLFLENLEIEGVGRDCMFTAPKKHQQLSLVRVKFINCGKNPRNLVSSRGEGNRLNNQPTDSIRKEASVPLPSASENGVGPRAKLGLMACEKYPSPCIALTKVGNPIAVKEAIARIPLSGGTLVVLPGVYPISKEGFIWLSNRKWLTIVGILDEQGNRPHFQGIKGNTPNTIIPWRGTNGDLTIRNLEISGAGSDCIFTGSKRGKQVIRLQNVDIHHCGHHAWMYGWDESGQWNNEAYAENSSFHHSGSTHVIYIDRIKKAEFKNIKAYSPKSYHAFKCVAIECNLFDSEISNGTLQGEWDVTSHWTAHQRLKGYLGGAPLSLIACQRGRMERNIISFRYNGDRYTGGSVISRQPRHAIFGCDQPPYSSSTHNDLNFWKKVKEKGLDLPEAIKNKQLLSMRWVDNTIRIFGERGSNTKLRIVTNKGTAPVVTTEKGATTLKYLPRPSGWVERSRDFLVGNCFLGVHPQDSIYDSTPWGGMRAGAVPPPPFVDRVLPVGVNECD